MMDMNSKVAVRRHLRDVLAQMIESDRRRKSLAACSLLSATPEFAAARVVMIYLSTPHELDTAPLALKCWQAGKIVVAPKVSWDQRRMLPIEVNCLQTGVAPVGAYQIREPVAGNPIPVDMIDLVVVPGVGFTLSGHRIGRGMGFYDRFLAQDDFAGVSCGLAFEEQVVDNVPILDHDMPLDMLATDRAITRFASKEIVGR